MRSGILPRILGSAVVLLSTFAVGCGGSDGMMTGPGGVHGSATMLLSVTPAGGSTGIGIGVSITIRFSGRMGPGMEAFADLHEGGLDGHPVSAHCDFSPDRTVLTCVPMTPLHSRTTYTLHLGGSLMDDRGYPIDMDEYRGTCGGQWIQGGMMGSSHDGSPWGSLDGSWHGMSGNYGMAFPFTTG